MHKYDDIINMPHHISSTHKPMSMYARAAQFAPFAALVGYDDKVKETARLTDKKIEIDEGLKSILDNKLILLQSNLKAKPVVTFTYFLKDNKKDGGKYLDITGTVKKLDLYKHVIVMDDSTIISMDDIINITGDLFKEL